MIRYRVAVLMNGTKMPTCYRGIRRWHGRLDAASPLLTRWGHIHNARGVIPHALNPSLFS